MRIGLIAPPWIPVPPDAYGGTESVIDLLGRGLVDAGHDVVLAASADSTCPVSRLPGTAMGDPAEIGKGESELKHVIHAYASLTDMDVIHDHTLAGGLYRHRPQGIPLVVTAHNPFASGFGDIYRTIAKDATLVAVSRHQAATAPASIIGRVIHHGLDTARVPVGTGKGSYVCFLGRMDPDKGVLQAIEVAMMAGVPLRIAAKMRSAAEHSYFSDVIEPLLGSSVEYLGELDPESKYALLGDSMALLNPIQWTEPFGMAMIEALATGTPVVATPRGSAPEIVRDGVNGFLRSSLRGLAEAIASIETIERDTCRWSAERFFGVERMVQKHLGLYEEVCAGRNNHEPSAGLKTLLDPVRHWVGIGPTGTPGSSDGLTPAGHNNLGHDVG